MIKDRTAEFASAIESLEQRQFNTASAVAKSSSALRNSAAYSAHSEFMQRAMFIGGGIQSVLGKLEKLAKLARSKSLFDDRPVEIQELSHIIKQDLAQINKQISDLQTFRKGLKSSGTATTGAETVANKSSEEHSSNVVVSLQSKLSTASSTFKNVLEMRTQNIRAQKDRREQFSATSVFPTAMRNPPTPIATASTTLTARPVSRISNSSHNSGAPSSTGRSGGDQSYDNSDSRSDHVAIDLPMQSFEQLSLIEQQDGLYLESRSNALQGIESTINELGSIYQQLANMVAEQGEVVQRIDMNIEDMHMNVQRGQDQLLRYLRNVSSNRWLMAKIFSILILFVVLFSVFFA